MCCVNALNNLLLLFVKLEDTAEETWKKTMYISTPVVHTLQMILKLILPLLAVFLLSIQWIHNSHSHWWKGYLGDL